VNFRFSILDFGFGRGARERRSETSSADADAIRVGARLRQSKIENPKSKIR
jgi:hypothetical protein